MVLGINEPEEGPTVRYYPWDGFNGDGAPSDVGDASVDDAQRDVPPSVREASVETSPPPPIVDSGVGRPDTATIVDVHHDALACLFHVPDGGGACGLGCSVLCPLKNACGRNGDCASGRCYASLCTMPYCLNKMHDGDESDVDCGGSCAFTCAVGQKCSNARDCQSGVCSAGTCQPRLQDASADAPRSDGSAGDAPRDTDAAETADAPLTNDVSDVAVANDVRSDSEPTDTPIVIIDDGGAPKAE